MITFLLRSKFIGKILKLPNFNISNSDHTFCARFPIKSSRAAAVEVIHKIVAHSIILARLRVTLVHLDVTVSPSESRITHARVLVDAINTSPSHARIDSAFI